jgi:hypothetical protein
MKIRNILLLIVCVSIVSACGQSPKDVHAMKVKKTWNIKLLVTGNGNNAAMKVNTGPMTGCINAQNGCMVFEKGQKGEVTFEMIGNHDGFHITELKLCKGAAPPVPLDANCELGDNNNDFYVVKSDGDVKIPNEDTGKIEWSYDEAIKTFVLNNQNSLPQIYYYLVKACDGADPATRHCVTADPPLENRG